MIIIARILKFLLVLKEPHSKKSLIAKNTMLLYMRMLVLLAISLYTSRIILSSLGVEDFGLYNVVGGVVTIFAFLSSAMANSSNRFITYSLPSGDNKHISKVISLTYTTHILLSILVILLAETLGLYLLLNKMTIPVDRVAACMWVFQFSVIACVFNIISIPFNAVIIAHEQMGMYAVISIIEAVLKLAIALIIQASEGDRLILYAGLMVLVNVVTYCIYRFYCSRKFEVAKNVRIIFNKFEELKEMFFFAGWSLIGNLAVAGFTQGLNILLNIFFGPVVNAARAIAVQIQGLVKSFVVNFQTAVNPQIIKTYACNELEQLHSLIIFSSKLSYFMLLCMTLPLILEVKIVLNIWLNDVPEYAIVFTRLILIISLVDALSNPLNIAINATGNIKKYQIVEGGTLLMILPLSYFTVKLGAPPESVLLIQMLITYLVQIIRVFIVCPEIKLSKITYLKEVILPVISVTLVSVVIAVFARTLFPQGTLYSLLMMLLSVMLVMSVAYIVGLKASERTTLNHKIRSFIKPER